MVIQTHAEISEMEAEVDRKNSTLDKKLELRKQALHSLKQADEIDDLPQLSLSSQSQIKEVEMEVCSFDNLVDLENSKVFYDLFKMICSEPHLNNIQLFRKWKEEGPMDIQRLIQKELLEFKEDLKYIERQEGDNIFYSGQVNTSN